MTGRGDSWLIVGQNNLYMGVVFSGIHDFEMEYGSHVVSLACGINGQILIISLSSPVCFLGGGSEKRFTFHAS